MSDTTIALKVLLAQAKHEPHNAPALWKAARILLNTPAHVAATLAAEYAAQEEKKKTNPATEKPAVPGEFLPIKAEFDYLDENGLQTHRTIFVMGFTDGRDIKRNTDAPTADRYGYLLTGYCTLRKQIRSFRSSRISNLRTFMEGESLSANRQWKSPTHRIAS
jgi:hypothetical protein